MHPLRTRLLRPVVLDDPIVRRKGDVFGMLSKVHVGARDVKLPLDQLQKEDESLAGGQMTGGGALPPGHP